jgi:5-methylcytosine-specific restriction endonuclease McrA
MYSKVCTSCRQELPLHKFAIQSRFLKTKDPRHPPTESHCSTCKSIHRMKCKPKWVDNQELGKIYKERPVGHEVDHIIPIRGKTVSGLHVPWNLQYLPMSENRKKSNKIP